MSAACAHPRWPIQTKEKRFHRPNLGGLTREPMAAYSTINQNLGEPSHHKLSDLATDIYIISKPLGKMYICESMGIENPGGKTSGSSSRTTKIINQMFFRVAAAPWKPPLSTILASSRPVEATTNSTILASSRPAYSLPSVKPYLQPHCQFDRDMNWQARPLHVFGL